LTVTVEYKKSTEKRYIFSNFNPVSQVILVQNQAITWWIKGLDHQF